MSPISLRSSHWCTTPSLLPSSTTNAMAGTSRGWWKSLSPRRRHKIMTEVHNWEAQHTAHISAGQPRGGHDDGRGVGSCAGGRAQTHYNRVMVENAGGACAAGARVPDAAEGPSMQPAAPLGALCGGHAGGDSGLEGMSNRRCSIPCTPTSSVASGGSFASMRQDAIASSTSSWRRCRRWRT